MCMQLLKVLREQFFSVQLPVNINYIFLKIQYNMLMEIVKLEIASHKYIV